MLMILAAYSWPVQSLTQRRTTEKAPLGNKDRRQEEQMGQLPYEHRQHQRGISAVSDLSFIVSLDHISLFKPPWHGIADIAKLNGEQIPTALIPIGLRVPSLLCLSSEESYQCDVNVSDMKQQHKAVRKAAFLVCLLVFRDDFAHQTQQRQTEITTSVISEC